MTPPRLALAAAQAWDAAVDAARLRIASDPALGRAPLVGAALLDLSVRTARLPLKSGGLGHTSAVLLSPIAFYAAYSQTLSLMKAPGRGCWRSRHARARAPHGCLPPFSRRSHVYCAISRATSLHCGAAKLSVAPPAAATLHSSSPG